MATVTLTDEAKTVINNATVDGQHLILAAEHVSNQVFSELESHLASFGGGWLKKIGAFYFNVEADLQKMLSSLKSEVVTVKTKVEKVAKATKEEEKVVETKAQEVAVEVKTVETEVVAKVEEVKEIVEEKSKTTK